MNDVWNLSNIYRDFDDPAFEADVSAGKEKVAELAALAGNLSQTDPLEVLRTGILLKEQISLLSQKLGMYAALRQYADSRDTAAQSQLGRLMAVYSGMAAPEAAF